MSSLSLLISMQLSCRMGLAVEDDLQCAVDVAVVAVEVQFVGYDWSGAASPRSVSSDDPLS